MKLGNMRFPLLVVSALSKLTSATSFENTAPLLISSRALTSSGVSFREIDTLERTNEKITQLTDFICSNYPNQRVSYIRINGLDESDIAKEFAEEWSLDSVSEHVVYGPDDTRFFYNIADSCSISAYFDSKMLGGKTWKDVSERTNTMANVFELYKDTAIDDLKEILKYFGDSELIIQGVPTFDAPSDTILDQASLKLNDLLNRKSNNKRDDIDYAEIEKELQESFEEINELLDDGLAEIYEKSEDNVYKSASQTNTKKHVVVDGSLFDKYGFFSTGIWMGTIVLLFLTWLLSIALGWLNSMQISYGAFEKPFDFEKKLQ